MQVNANLEFSWEYKSFKLRACPKTLARMHKEDRNETVDLVMRNKEADGKEWCFSLAYFVRTSECYELHFVGPRPFLYIDDEDIPKIWEGLKTAQAVLDAFFELEVE